MYNSRQDDQANNHSDKQKIITLHKKCSGGDKHDRLTSNNKVQQIERHQFHLHVKIHWYQNT